MESLEIAVFLGISDKTVTTFIARAMKKLHARTRYQLVNMWSVASIDPGILDQFSIKDLTDAILRSATQLALGKVVSNPQDLLPVTITPLRMPDDHD